MECGFHTLQGHYPRVKTLDGELGSVFKRWYLDMDIEVEEMPAVA